MSVLTIYRGDNRIVQRPLLQADGTTPLPTASLLALKVRLMQGARVLRTLVQGTDPEVRYGGDGQSVELELTSEITRDLPNGLLTEQWTWEISDPRFVAEPGKHIGTTSVQEISIE